MNELRQALEDLKKIARDNPNYTMDDIIDHINIKIVDLGAKLDDTEKKLTKALGTCPKCNQFKDNMMEVGEIGNTEILCEDCYLKGLTEDTEPEVDDHYCYSKVNGTTFREKELEHPLPWDKFKPGDVLSLEREPSNEFDANAIKVIYGYEDNLHIGYIPKNTAETLAKLMDDGELFFFASITEITGGEEDKENHGININIRFRKKED